MDIAATLIDYLDQATALEWYHDAPVGAPDEYGTVTRDGGPTELVRDLPTVTLIVDRKSSYRCFCSSFCGMRFRYTLA